MPIPKPVTIIAFAEEGGDAARHGKCTFPSATEASVVHHSTNRWMLGSQGHTAKCTVALFVDVEEDRALFTVGVKMRTGDW